MTTDQTRAELEATVGDTLREGYEITSHVGDTYVVKHRGNGAVFTIFVDDNGDVVQKQLEKARSKPSRRLAWLGVAFIGLGLLLTMGAAAASSGADLDCLDAETDAITNGEVFYTCQGSALVPFLGGAAGLFFLVGIVLIIVGLVKAASRD